MTVNTGQLTTVGNSSVSCLIWWHTFSSGTFWSCYLARCMLGQFNHRAELLWSKMCSYFGSQAGNKVNSVVRGQAVFRDVLFFEASIHAAMFNSYWLEKKKKKKKDFVTQIDKSGLTFSIAVHPEWCLLYRKLLFYQRIREVLCIYFPAGTLAWCR